MAETATAGIQVPPSTITSDDLSKLNAILDGDEATEAKTPAPAPTEPPKAATPAPATTETKTEPPAPEPTSEELKNLDNLLKDATVTEETTQPDKVSQQAPPPATPEAARLQQWGTNPEYAKAAVESVDTMIRLQNAANSGDVAAVLNEFHPNFQNALVEHWYQQNKEAIVKRFIAEHEGTIPKPDPRIDQLQAQLEELRSQQTEEHNRRQSLEQDWNKRQSQRNYDDYWGTLFTATKINDDAVKDYLQGVVLAKMNREARNGNKAAQTHITQIQRGDYRPLGQRYKDAFIDYTDRLKARNQQVEATRTAQEDKKGTQLATGAQAATQTNSAETKSPDFDEDGKRTQSFLARGMKKLGLLDD